MKQQFCFALKFSLKGFGLNKKINTFNKSNSMSALVSSFDEKVLLKAFKSTLLVFKKSTHHILVLLCHIFSAYSSPYQKLRCWFRS